MAARNSIESSREWPKNLGIGKPYKPDDRLQNFLDAYLDESEDISNLKKNLSKISKESSGYALILIKSIMKILG